MKKITLLIFVLSASLMFFGQSTISINNVNFESAGGYTTSVTEFSDGGYDFFTRTDGTNIGSSYVVTNIQGSYYFAAQDTDGDGEPSFLTLNIDDIDISGYTSLQLRVYLAEDDDGTNQDWDDDTWVHFLSDIDNSGTFSNLIWIEAEGGTNSVPKIDTDFNGYGDGTEITSDFTQFTVNITGTGSLLDLKVEFNNLDAGDEDIAIDNIEIVGIAAGGVANPTDFAATTGGSDNIDLNWTQNGNGDNVMVAYNTTNTFGTPTNGTPYSAGNSITGGGEVIYNGSNISYNHSSLASDTRFYYMAWSVDGSDTYSSGVSADTTTLADKPTTDATSFSATANSTSEITVTWTDATGVPDAYLIKGSDIGFGDITDPIDGTPESDDVLVKNVSSGIESFQFTGLTPSTTYYFQIYPFNGDNGSISYKIDSPAQATTATQDPTGATAGDIIITEVMQDPTDVSDGSGEWFELFNTTGSGIDIDGWTISDNGSDSHTINNGGALTVPAGGFLILGNNSTTSTNGGVPVDYQFPTNFYLSNSDDELILTSDESVEIDRIEWDGGTTWPDPSGASMVFTGLPTDDNNDGTKWIEALTRENSYTNPGGIETDLGSPGTNGLYQNLISTTTWTGTGNWSEGNGVGNSNWSAGSPGSEVNVTIDGTITVDMSGNNPAVCNDLSLLSDASLTISANNGLTVNGDLDIASFKSRNAGSFVVESDANGNGSFIGKGMMLGDVDVERYMVGYTPGLNDGWHQIASPIDFMTISGSDLEPGANDDLYEWNEQNALWVNYKPSKTFAEFRGGQGYLVAYETTSTKHFTGMLTGDNFDVQNLPYTSFEGNGWNFLGNPYPSAIEWNTSDWALTHIGNVAEIWDEGAGNYAMINPGDPIPSTNGFFVQVESSVYNGDNSLTIPAAARVHNTTNNYKSSNAVEMDETLVLKVTNDENSYYDVNRIGFKPEATEAWDIAFDAHKLSGNEAAPQLWTISNGENFAQNYLPYTSDEYPVPLHFRAGVNGTYHIDASGLNSFYDATDIYLEDRFADKMINLKDQPFYTFTATTDDDDARFVLHFYGITSTGENPDASTTQIYAYQNKVYVKFDQLPKDDYTVEVINMIGQQVYAGSFAPSGISSFTLNEKPGVYFVRLRTDNKSLVQNIMIK